MGEIGPHGTAWLGAGLLACVMAASALGQGASSAPAGSPGRVLGTHLIVLHQDQLRIQSEVLRIQAAELARLGAGTPEQGDPGGAGARQQLRQLEDQLRKLELQIRSLAGELGQLPPGSVPPEIMGKLQELKGQAGQNARAIRQNFSEIRKLVDPGTAGQVPDGGEPDKASDGEQGPAGPARDSRAAGDMVMSGQVKNPRHLVELFEQIPQAETPRGNLNYYLGLRRR